MEMIRAFLKAAIDSKGIKLTYVASKIGMTVDLLSKSINGTRKISADEFLKLCKALNISQQDIGMLVANITEHSA